MTLTTIAERRPAKTEEERSGQIFDSSLVLTGLLNFVDGGH